MVDGGVSIAVRSVYPGKQARILSYEVLQEAKKRQQSRVPSIKFRRPWIAIGSSITGRTT
jgi:hypothetical protein